MSSFAVKRRTARKQHRCPCHNRIESGDVYLLHTEFPGGDAGYADSAGHPVTMPECADCATRYDRGYLLEPLPPEQAHRVYLEAMRNGQG